jgi:hypothetical protein
MATRCSCTVLDVQFVFLFFILRIPVLDFGDSNFKEQSIFLSSNKLWNEKRFLKYGCPVITTDDEVYLHRDSDYTFIPQYSVLDSGTAIEKNIYIFLEKVTNVFFHLYGQIHPRGPNYRINFIELVIEKCNNIESCQQLNDCRKAVVMDSDKLELSNTTIYISYWVEMYNKLMILVQYKNKHIICVDASDPLLVRKIVMNASEPQTISTSENIFKQTDQVSTSVFDPQFTLYSGNTGYIYILQCRFCTTELTIKCQSGDPIINTVDTSNTSKIVFSDGSVVEGWQKINFPQTLHKKTYTNCSLVFTTNTTNDFPITHFWIIDRCVVNITKPAENKSTTEKMNEDKNCVCVCDNFYKIAFCSLLILDFIIVFIIFICYIILRSRRSVHQSTRLEETELELVENPSETENTEEGQTSVCRKRSISTVN